MKTIEAHFKIVTPMFIAGGSTEDDPDLRPPSIKGALRFWWRAIHWGECIKESSSKSEALKQLYQQEADLFGAAVTDEKYGQGLFSLKLNNIAKKNIEQTWPKHSPIGAGYIGYGLDATKASRTSEGQPHRKGLNPTEFTITLILKKKITEQQTQQLKNSLKAWGLLGGLGARARRGYGSVALINLDNQNYQFKTDKDYFTAIQKLLGSFTLSPAMPLFTAFNEDMKIASTKQLNKDERRIMDTMGNLYKDERQSLARTADRAVYGLPLEKVDTKNRRSSPLLFHVHVLGTGHIGIFSFIPADFHFDKDYSEKKMRPLFKSVEKFMDKMEAIYP